MSKISALLKCLHTRRIYSCLTQNSLYLEQMRMFGIIRQVDIQMLCMQSKKYRIAILAAFATTNAAFIRESVENNVNAFLYRLATHYRQKGNK